MKQSAFDKITGLLKKYRIEYAELQGADVWVSLATQKNIDPEIAKKLPLIKYNHVRAEIAQALKSNNVVFKTTHSNFKGYTFWVRQVGISITSNTPNCTTEFDNEGKFIRATILGAFTPGHQCNTITKTELLDLIERRNPERIIQHKQKTIDEHKKDLADYTNKICAELNKVNAIREDVAAIVGVDNAVRVFDVLESHGIKITYQNVDNSPYLEQIAKAEKDLADYKKSLETGSVV